MCTDIRIFYRGTVSREKIWTTPTIHVRCVQIWVDSFSVKIISNGEHNHHEKETQQVYRNDTVESTVVVVIYVLV